MTVKLRPYKGRTDKWEVDIRFEYPNGEICRQRVVAPVPSKSGAKKWAEQRERELLLAGPKKEEDQAEGVLTLLEFWPRYVEEHLKAEKRKPSYVRSAEQIYRTHLKERLGHRRLCDIANVDIARLKADLAKKSVSTVNNVLSTLSMTLKKAQEWELINEMPCSIRLLKVAREELPFYDFADYEHLVTTAEKMDARQHLVILLGGDAGLRLGEILALCWAGVQFDRNRVVVSESEWRGEVTKPKSGHDRVVPMTMRLAKALKAFKHLRGDRVLYHDVKDQVVTEKVVKRWVEGVERRAGRPQTGRVHIFRHTFCAHLAMRGAPAKAIQELAGHADLTTTMRYMHLSPAAKEGAIALLDAGRATDGEMLEATG